MKSNLWSRIRAGFSSVGDMLRTLCRPPPKVDMAKIREQLEEVEGRSRDASQVKISSALELRRTLDSLMISVRGEKS